MSDYITMTGLGGCREIGRSCFLLKTPNRNILLDCGVNFEDEKFPHLEQVIHPSKIDLVILTHAHMDHSGYIPVLCEQGFGGTILATEHTMALSMILFVQLVQTILDGSIVHIPNILKKPDN